MGSTGGDDYDVIVVGARVAGCVLAALLGRQGRKVALVDRAHLDAPTVSTHFFRGGGLVSVLQALGVIESVLALGSPRLIRQWVHSPAGPVEGPPQNPGDPGYCLSVRRSTLDPLLIDCAASQPTVDYRPNTKVTGLAPTGARVRGVEADGPEGKVTLSGRLVVGADGRRSAIAAAVGAGFQEQEPGHRSLFYRYVRGWTAPDGGNPDAAEFSPGDDEMAYVFPSDDGWTCIAATVNTSTAQRLKGNLANGFDDVLSRHAGLAGRFAECGERTRIFGGPTGMNYVREGGGPGWMLVGDAGQHQDPWTGVGMDLAGLTATAAARHVGSFLDGPIGEDEMQSAWAEERDAIGRDTWRVSVEGSRRIVF